MIADYSMIVNQSITVKLPLLPAGWVLAAFFYGYLVTQIPGGLLAQRVGGKWVFGLGVLITAVLTTLTPFAADTSIWLLVALRVLEGLSEVCKLYNQYAAVSGHKVQVNINLHSNTNHSKSTGLHVGVNGSYTCSLEHTQVHKRKRSGWYLLFACACTSVHELRMVKKKKHIYKLLVKLLN